MSKLKYVIGVALAFVLITPVQAKIYQYDTRIQMFCGDRYCGQIEQQPRKRIKKAYKKRYKSIRIVKYKSKYKEILQKRIQVASLGSEPITEHSTGLLSVAKSYLGTNPTGWRRLWCARFIAQIAPGAASVLKRMGLNPNWARDYARLPGVRRNGSIGDLVVLTRGRGGHIGVVSGFDRNGNPKVISGNHNRVVGEGIYSKSRVLGYASI